MSTQFEKIAELKKQYEEAVKAVGREGIQKLLAPLFEQYPTVRAVRWTQYTPYFNDGEPCVFDSNASYADVSFGAEDGGEEDNGFLSSYDFKEGTTESEAINAFQQALSVDDDILLAAFGDHSQVTVDREGVEVEEYEHD